MQTFQPHNLGLQIQSQNNKAYCLDIYPNLICSLWITDNEYDKYYEVFRNEISEIDAKTALLQDVEDNYYITAKYLLELANRAYELLISSEVEEKRQFLKLVPSNLRIAGDKVRYEAVKPFDSIFVLFRQIVINGSRGGLSLELRSNLILNTS